MTCYPKWVQYPCIRKSVVREPKAQTMPSQLPCIEFYLQIIHPRIYPICIDRRDSVCYLNRKAPLFARVEREIIHVSVILGPDVVQTAVVPKCTPLHVHAHPTLLTFHCLNVPQLFHVTRVTARSCIRKQRLLRRFILSLNWAVKCRVKILHNIKKSHLFLEIFSHLHVFIPWRMENRQYMDLNITFMN